MQSAPGMRHSMRRLWPVADHAEAGGAVVVAPREPRRRPRAVDVALVRVDRRRVEHHHVGHVRDPAAEEPAERVGALHGPSVRRREGVLAVAPQAEVDVAARAGAVGGELRHEGDAQARRVGELLQALLEDDVAVGHLERFGVAHVDLVLARPHSPLEFSTGTPECFRCRRTAAWKSSVRVPCSMW